MEENFRDSWNSILVILGLRLLINLTYIEKRRDDKTIIGKSSSSHSFRPRKGEFGIF